MTRGSGREDSYGVELPPSSWHWSQSQCHQQGTQAGITTQAVMTARSSPPALLLPNPSSTTSSAFFRSFLTHPGTFHHLPIVGMAPA